MLPSEEASILFTSYNIIINVCQFKWQTEKLECSVICHFDSQMRHSYDKQRWAWQSNEEDNVSPTTSHRIVSNAMRVVCNPVLTCTVAAKCQCVSLHEKLNWCPRDHFLNFLDLVSLRHKSPIVWLDSEAADSSSGFATRCDMPVENTNAVTYI